MKTFNGKIGSMALITGLFFAAAPAGALQENAARFFVVRHADGWRGRTRSTTRGNAAPGAWPIQRIYPRIVSGFFSRNVAWGGYPSLDCASEEQ